MTAGLSELEQLTAAQWGLVTAAQAARAGVSRVQLSRLVTGGHLERVLNGIYRSSATPQDRAQDVQAAWLTSDPARTAAERIADGAAGVVVGGATAAYLHEIGDLQPEPIELYAPDRRQTERPGIRYRIRALDEADVTLVDGLPVTSVERTLADLIRDRYDLSLVADALRDAVQRGALDLDRLELLLDPLAASHGRPDGAALLQWLADTAQVELRPIRTSRDVQLRWLQQAVDAAAGHLDPIRKTVLAQVIDASALQQALIDSIRSSGVLDAVATMQTAAALPAVDIARRIQKQYQQQLVPLQHLARPQLLVSARTAAIRSELDDAARDDVSNGHEPAEPEVR